MGNVYLSWFSFLFAIKLSENGISIGVSIYLFTLTACTFLFLQALFDLRLNNFFFLSNMSF